MGIGRDGEELAVAFLTKKSYQILSQNYHSRFGEIDIIAKENDCIVFVEVKTRNNKSYGTPLEAINKFKLQKIIKTSQFFLNQFKYGDVPYRYDAIEIMFEFGEAKIDHIENIIV